MVVGCTVAHYDDRNDDCIQYTRMTIVIFPAWLDDDSSSED